MDHIDTKCWCSQTWCCTITPFRAQSSQHQILPSNQCLHLSHSDGESLQQLSNTSLPEDFPTVHHQMEVLHPPFGYWSMALELELQLLPFLKSVWSGSLSMYKNALKQLLQWFFALDHYHYARWFTFHWYEMLTINQTNPNTS